MPKKNIVLEQIERPGQMPSQGLVRLQEHAQVFATNAKSEATRTAYSQQWERFEEWCRDHGLTTLPALPITVASYTAYLAEEGIRPSSIDLALVAISQAHKLSGHDSPTRSSIVRETLKGIKRQVGTATTQKAPIVVEHLRRIVDTLGDDLIGLRDRALVLVGFAGALFSLTS